MNNSESRIESLLNEIGSQLEEINEMSKAEIAQNIADSTDNADYWATLISKQADLITEYRKQESNPKMTVEQITEYADLQNKIEQLNFQLKTATEDRNEYQSKYYDEITLNAKLSRAMKALAALIAAE